MCDRDSTMHVTFSLSLRKLIFHFSNFQLMQRLEVEKESKTVKFQVIRILWVSDILRPLEIGKQWF